MSRGKVGIWLAVFAVLVAAAMVTVGLCSEGESASPGEPANALVIDARRDMEAAPLPRLETRAPEPEKKADGPQESAPVRSSKPSESMAAPRKPCEDWQHSELPHIDDEFYDINHDHQNDVSMLSDMAREYDLAQLLRFTEVNPDSLEFTEDAFAAITEAVGPELQAYRALDKRVGETTHAAIRRNVEEGRCEEPRYTESGYPLIPRALSPDEQWTHTRGDLGDYFVRFDREHDPEVFEMQERRRRAAEALLVDLRRLVQLYGHEKN